METNNMKQIMEQTFGKAQKNMLTGWYLDEVIDFCFWHNAYMKGRASLETIILELKKKCHMSIDNFQQVQELRDWTNDVVRMLGYCVVNYLELVDEFDGDCDECNLQLSGQWISDSLLCREDAFFMGQVYI